MYSCSVLNSSLACTAGSLLSFSFRILCEDRIFNLQFDINFLLAFFCGWLRLLSIFCTIFIPAKIAFWIQRITAKRQFFGADTDNSTSSYRLHHICKSGPKSGHSDLISRTSLVTALICLLLLLNMDCSDLAMTSTTTLSGGEGCLNRSWIKTEADFNADALTQLLEAKHHDKALQIGYGHENPSETAYIQQGSETQLQKSVQKSLGDGKRLVPWTMYDTGSVCTWPFHSVEPCMSLAKKATSIFTHTKTSYANWSC